MKIRQIPKTFDVIKDLKYKNLVVSGCSFTYNLSDTYSSSWPYYTRDKCGFDHVYDCSAPGAANYQILTSTMYALEKLDLEPSDTLIIVMWSGYGRDSKIVANYNQAKSWLSYTYIDGIFSVTPSMQINDTIEKNEKSRALENYIYVTALHNYLKNQGYQLVFLDFVDPKLPNRGGTFNILKFLPKKLQKKFSAMFTHIENFHTFCVTHDLLGEDDFHPTMKGHLEWTHNVLVPALTVNPKFTT